MRGAASGRALLLWALLPTTAAWSAQFQGSLGASTDNVFRGLSLSQDQPSVEADAYLNATHWYGGLSAESIKRQRNASTSAELIGYLGYQQLLSESWSSSLSVRHYDYVGMPRRSRYDYDELDAALSWRQQLMLSLIASPDTYSAAAYRRFGRGAAYAAEFSGRLPLPYGLSADAGIGYYDLRSQIGTGYVYWSAGVGKQWRSWEVGLRYIGTDSQAHRLFGIQAADRALASVTWFF